MANHPNDINDDEDQFFAQVRSADATRIPTWAVSEPYINLWLFDQPLTYTTSYGQPIGFGVAYKQRNNRSNANVFGLGPAWECSWLSYVEYAQNGTNITVGTNYVKLGGARLYVADGATKEFKSASTMTKLWDGASFLGFQINYPSGAKETYGYLHNGAAFLNEQIDPSSRTNRFVYDVVDGGVVKLRKMIDSDTRGAWT